jgi:hypothetical protein
MAEAVGPACHVGEKRNTGRATEDRDITETTMRTIAEGRRRAGALIMSDPMDGNHEAVRSSGLCGTAHNDLSKLTGLRTSLLGPFLLSVFLPCLRDRLEHVRNAR